MRLVGVRSYGDVEVAVRSGSQGNPPPFAAGASAAYEWAMGASSRSPVTGVGAEGVPEMGLLTAEVDAAVVRLEDPVLPEDDRAYTEGARDALSWLCGYREDAP
ncbi:MULTISPECIES: hypothetical protein [unclassified Streptomyces]|uniref:hypothetical protein n=1 Tax=unclassified Streptomyces TaxID=2593676 RepID=UPI00131A907D|nr:hypothetical protein [Streptomyces sp. NRRL S-118]